MPSLNYVIELSGQAKAELIDIVTKGKSPAGTQPSLPCYKVLELMEYYDALEASQVG